MYGEPEINSLFQIAGDAYRARLQVKWRRKAASTSPTTRVFPPRRF